MNTIRQQLWTTVATNIASMIGVNNKDTPVTWADAMLEAFDKRFAELSAPAPEPDTIAQLKAELETERMRLAAISVAAVADTPESAAKARQMLPEYESPALHDVIRRVDECMSLRVKVKQLERWKEEQMEVSRRWDEVDARVRSHPSVTIGKLVTDEALRLIRERDEYRNMLRSTDEVL